MTFTQAPQTRYLLIGLPKILFAFLLFVAVIPVLFLGTWVQRKALDAEIQAVEEKHLLLAKNLSGALSRYSKDVSSTFRATSNLESVPFSPVIVRLLEDLQIQAMFVVEADRESYLLGNSSFLPKTGLNELSEQRKAAFSKPQTVIISPIIFSRDDTPMFYLLRVNNVNQLVIGAVDTAYIQEVQRAITFGEKGHAAIVDQTGQAIAHPLEAWQTSAKDMSQLEPVQAMLAEQTGVMTFFSPALKADMIAGYTFVPETRWGVMIPQPYSELEANAFQTRIAAFAISILGLLLAGVVSWCLTDYLLEPVKSLIKASSELARGEKIGKLNLQSNILPKEFFDLLQAFESMAGEVSQVRLTLEQRVEERTQELVNEVEMRKELEKQLIQQATHDHLTGLPNRSLLGDRLEQVLALAQRSEMIFSLLFIDLDGFKQVNDTYGHKVGDRLLIQVANRLRENLRNSDTIFRLGGDEFVVLIEQLDSSEFATLIAAKILEQLVTPFLIDSYEVMIGGSIGIKISDGLNGTTAETILVEADKAMYQAKKNGNCSILV